MPAVPILSRPSSLRETPRSRVEYVTPCEFLNIGTWQAFELLYVMSCHVSVLVRYTLDGLH
jgi:hypothetical protein